LHDKKAKGHSASIDAFSMALFHCCPWQCHDIIHAIATMDASIFVDKQVVSQLLVQGRIMLAQLFAKHCGIATELSAICTFTVAITAHLHHGHTGFVFLYVCGFGLASY
jgi:ubiquinone biosynthesis protein Coq4